MAAFVLVHGAFHGAWCWVKLAPLLVARGHRVATPDMPSLGADTTPIADVTLGSWVDRVVETVAAQGEPVVLLGHSLGGIVIAPAAERVPERIALLVYLCAFMPRDGDSVMSLSASPAARKETGPKAFTRSEDGLSFAPVAELAGSKFYSGCAAEDVAYAVPKMRPQAYTVQRETVHLTAERYGRVRRAYVACTEDNTVSIGLQRDMVAKAPCEVVSLPTDHSPFFSAPELLADTLDRLARAG
jgi:pimeloyl-ACP methyl ester carboxylesterase